MEEERQTRSEEVSEHQNGNAWDTDIQSSGTGTDTENTQEARRGTTSDSSIICPGKDNRSFQHLTVDEVKSMKFESFEAGEEFYRRYADFMGFSVRKNGIKRNRNDKVRLGKWVCNREGSRNKMHLERKDRKRSPKPITRINCPAKFRLGLDQKTNMWVVREFVAEHTHELVLRHDASIIRPNFPIKEADRAQFKAMLSVGVNPGQVIESLVQLSGGYEKVGFEKKDLDNYIDSQCRVETVEGDAECALAFLSATKDEDPRFFYESKIVEGRLTSLFWADSVSQMDYACFGEVMAFDSTYKSNAYKMPFIILAGLNHHNQTSVFGCALLEGETVEAFTWMLLTFLRAMRGKTPASIVTNGDKGIVKAIQCVFPQTRHRLCTWHLERNANVNVQDKAFISDFKVCMLDIFTKDDFERRWKEMVEKHDLNANPWIERMYKKRHMWAEAYLRGHFWAELRSIKICDGMSVYLNKFLQRKLKLYEFVQQYNKALRRVRHNEAKADYDTYSFKHVPSTPFVKIEKHAASVFTLESFGKFLTEIRLEALFFVLNRVEFPGCRIYTLGNYEQREFTCEVVFKPCDPSINCSCLKFETVGLPCSHAIHIIKVERLEEIPLNLIHPRWTKVAKSTIQLVHHDSLMANNIMQEVRYGALLSSCYAMCFLGSKSEHSYNELTREIARLACRMEELSTTCNTSNEKRKNVCNGRKEKRAQCVNMDHTESRCPDPIDSNSAVDCNPHAIQDALDSSSEDETQLNVSFQMEKGQTSHPPCAFDQPTSVGGNCWPFTGRDLHASVTPGQAILGASSIGMVNNDAQVNLNSQFLNTLKFLTHIFIIFWVSH